MKALIVASALTIIWMLAIEKPQLTTILERSMLAVVFRLANTAHQLTMTALGRALVGQFLGFARPFARRFHIVWWALGK